MGAHLRGRKSMSHNERHLGQKGHLDNTHRVGLKRSLEGSSGGGGNGNIVGSAVRAGAQGQPI